MSISRAEAYELLQVTTEASEDEIKSSYRRLALKYHPDKNKDDDQSKAIFQRINAAYHLLTSDQEVNSLSEDQIATLFQHLIRSELFSFLSRTFSFSEDDSDYYDTDEECLNCEQWQKIEKKAQENAQQLVQEEEQEKKKLEKKRERRKKHKQRRKEKKREEKDLTKGDENTEKYEIKEVSDFPKEKARLKQDAPVTIKKQKQQKEQRREPASSDSDQPDIDLGSAFCSKVKQKVEKERSRKASEKDGSKRESPTTEPDIKPEPQSTRNGHTEPLNQSVINHKTQPKQKQYVQPNPPNEEEFFKSQEHARKGNELAQFGKLHNAIEEYSQAIQLNKTDHRCYGNRSYCYHLLKKYEEALSDSDNAVRLVPNEPKGYFRKAKALCGLKRFSEAESALKKILELDAGCEEARHELFEVRMLQLQDFGFDRRACEHALMKAKGDIQAAIEFLLSSQVKDNMSFGTSDTSDNEQPVHHNHRNNNGPKPQTQQFQSYFPVVPPGSYTTSPLRMPLPTPPPGRPPLIPPFQPVQNVQFTSRPPPQMTPAVQSMPPQQMPIRQESSKRKFDPRDYSLWIGHFDSKKVSEKDLYDVFAKYGKVSGVVIIKTHGKPLAYSFIHFMKHEDAKRAYNAAQNHVIQGISLDVNWNKNPTIECEHWLRGHCPYNNCHYLHVVDHHFR